MSERYRALNFDRLWRLLALIILCGLVYYFSFDNGLQTGKMRIERLQREISGLTAENESLKTQLNLRSQEIKALREELLKNLPTPPPAPQISNEDNQLGDVPPETPDELTPTPNATPNAASAQGGDPTITLPAERDEGEASLSSTTPKNSHTEVTRFSMRNEDNKLILDNQVLLSVLEVDSLDKTATVRVHFLDTEARETRNMGLGDSFVIERKEKNYRLLLDQLKGSQAVFLLIEL